MAISSPASTAAGGARLSTEEMIEFTKPMEKCATALIDKFDIITKAALNLHREASKNPDRTLTKRQRIDQLPKLLEFEKAFDNDRAEVARIHAKVAGVKLERNDTKITEEEWEDVAEGFAMALALSKGMIDEVWRAITTVEVIILGETMTRVRRAMKAPPRPTNAGGYVFRPMMVSVPGIDIFSSLDRVS